MLPHEPIIVIDRMGQSLWPANQSQSYSCTDLLESLSPVHIYKVKLNFAVFKAWTSSKLQFTDLYLLLMKLLLTPKAIARTTIKASIWYGEQGLLNGKGYKITQRSYWWAQLSWRTWVSAANRTTNKKKTIHKDGTSLQTFWFAKHKTGEPEWASSNNGKICVEIISTKIPPFG